MERKHVLIAPLDWGLGHATRCIPIILLLLQKQCKVSIATSGKALPLLKQEFPALDFYVLPSYSASYSLRLPLIVKVFLQLPKFLTVIRQEHRCLEEIVLKNKIDLIISDNRFGCWSSKAHSIFITHQLDIIMPLALRWMQPIVNLFNRMQIKRFDECWIPDDEHNNLTGKLTHSAAKLNAKFIGMLSRLHRKNDSTEKIFNILALISGPEPQRTKFEEIIRKQFNTLNIPSLIVKGLPGEDQIRITKGNVSEVNHLSSEELQSELEKAHLIICRSGYSSIMDLAAMGAKAIFIPTPGQTEQEYLAVQLEGKGIAHYQQQSKINIAEAIAKSKKYTGFAGWEGQSNLLPELIENLLK